MKNVSLFFIIAAIIFAFNVLNLKASNPDSTTAIETGSEITQSSQIRLIVEGIFLFIGFIALIWHTMWNKSVPLMFAVPCAGVMVYLTIARFHYPTMELDVLQFVLYGVLAVTFSYEQIRSRNAAMLLIGALLLVTPKVQAQSSSAMLGIQLQEDNFGFRFSSHLHLETEAKVSFLVITEFAKEEALVMQGVTLHGVGLVGGVFIQPLTSVSDVEDETVEGITMGFGLMGVYQKDWKDFHISIEGGVGHNYERFVPLYDAQVSYLGEKFSFGGRVHYELGVGLIGGWQILQHLQLSAGAFRNEHHHDTYYVGMTVNHLGVKHH